MTVCKRLLSALLCMVLLIALTACVEESPTSTNDCAGNYTTATAPTTPTTAPPDPLELYREAYGKTLALAGLHYKQELTAHMVGPGMTMDMTVVGEARVVEEDGKIAFAQSVTTTLLGQTATQVIHFRDGTMYEYDGEYGCYYTLTEDESAPYIAKAQKALLPVGELADFRLETEDGRTVVVATMTKAHVEKMLSESGMLDGMIGTAEGNTVTAEDSPVRMTLNADGYVDAMTVNFSVNAAVSGTEMQITMTMTVTLPDVGQPVTIAWPDFSDYEDVSLSEVERAVSDALWDKDGNPVDDWDAQYAALVAIYGAVDVNYAVAYWIYDEVTYAVYVYLYDEEGYPVSNYDAVYAELCAMYGQAEVDASITYLTEQ